MSGRKPGKPAGRSAPPLPRQPSGLHNILLDGGLLDAAAHLPGGSPSKKAGGSPGWRPGDNTSQRRSPGTGGAAGAAGRKARALAGSVMLDKGESEAAFIGTLRTHYTRNSTAETFASKFASAPHKIYSRRDRPGAAAGGSLQQQERALWEEREEELLDAQDRRFGQMEDALAAREAKRDAYLVHRLEATAAQKIQEHRKTQEAAARARQLSVQRVQQLPALRQARAATQPASNAAALRKLATHPAFPAPPSLAAALAQAAASVRSPSAIATLQAGLESSQGHDLPPLGGAGRPGWQEKRQAATEVHVDAVYRQIQAVKAAGGRLLSPLDAAKEATQVPNTAAIAPTAAPIDAEDSWEAGVAEQQMAAYEAYLADQSSARAVEPPAGCSAPASGHGSIRRCSNDGAGEAAVAHGGTPLPTDASSNMQAAAVPLAEAVEAAVPQEDAAAEGELEGAAAEPAAAEDGAVAAAGEEGQQAPNDVPTAEPQPAAAADAQELPPVADAYTEEATADVAPQLEGQAPSLLEMAQLADAEPAVAAVVAGPANEGQAARAEASNSSSVGSCAPADAPPVEGTARAADESAVAEPAAGEEGEVTAQMLAAEAGIQLAALAAEQSGAAAPLAPVVAEPIVVEAPAEPEDEAAPTAPPHQSPSAGADEGAGLEELAILQLAAGMEQGAAGAEPATAPPAADSSVSVEAAATASLELLADNAAIAVEEPEVEQPVLPELPVGDSGTSEAAADEPAQQLEVPAATSAGQEVNALPDLSSACGSAAEEAAPIAPPQLPMDGQSTIKDADPTAPPQLGADEAGDASVAAVALPTLDEAEQPKEPAALQAPSAIYSQPVQEAAAIAPLTELEAAAAAAGEVPPAQAAAVEAAREEAAAEEPLIALPAVVEAAHEEPPTDPPEVEEVTLEQPTAPLAQEAGDVVAAEEPPTSLPRALEGAGDAMAAEEPPTAPLAQLAAAEYMAAAEEPEEPPTAPVAQVMAGCDDATAAAADCSGEPGDCGKAASPHGSLLATVSASETVLEAGTVSPSQGPHIQPERSSVGAADSAEAVEMTARASASLLFGGDAGQPQGGASGGGQWGREAGGRVQLEGGCCCRRQR